MIFITVVRGLGQLPGTYTTWLLGSALVSAGAVGPARTSYIKHRAAALASPHRGCPCSTVSVQTWTQIPNVPLLATSPAPGRPRAALSPPPVIVLGFQLPIQDLGLGLAQAWSDPPLPGAQEGQGFWESPWELVAHLVGSSIALPAGLGWAASVAHRYNMAIAGLDLAGSWEKKK